MAGESMFAVVGNGDALASGGYWGSLVVRQCILQARWADRIQLASERI